MSAELPPDRALIGIMIYTFARVGAVLQMNVGDYFSQGRRGWVRLHEKGGKYHEAPCIPKLETYLDEYIAAAGIADDKDGPLVSNHRALDRHAAPVDATGRLQADTALRKAGGYQNADRQSHYAGEGSLSEARKMANHADTRTTQLYDRRSDAASLDEYQKVGI